MPLTLDDALPDSRKKKLSGENHLLLNPKIQQSVVKPVQNRVDNV
jgi:hypothetical protein